MFLRSHAQEKSWKGALEEVVTEVQKVGFKQKNLPN